MPEYAVFYLLEVGLHTLFFATRVTYCRKGQIKNDFNPNRYAVIHEKKPREIVIDAFTREHYPKYIEDCRVDILMENTAFGVGGVVEHA